MLLLEQIKEEIKSDLKNTKILDIRKVYKKKEDIEKVLIIQKVIKCSKLAKTIDLLINEKFQKIQFAGVENGS